MLWGTSKIALLECIACRSSEDSVALRRVEVVLVRCCKRKCSGELAYPPATTTAKAVLYDAMREAGINKSELAHRLGVDEKEVRRMRLSRQLCACEPVQADTLFGCLHRQRPMGFRWDPHAKLSAVVFFRQRNRNDFATRLHVRDR